MDLFKQLTDTLSTCDLLGLYNAAFSSVWVAGSRTRKYALMYAPKGDALCFLPYAYRDDKSNTLHRALGVSLAQGWVHVASLSLYDIECNIRAESYAIEYPEHV